MEDPVRISCQRLSHDALDLRFSPDALDGVPPIGTVRLRARHLGRLKGARIGLLGYLLCRDISANLLRFDGGSVPAFLAGAVMRHETAREIHVEGLTNATSALSPPGEPRRFNLAVAQPGEKVAARTGLAARVCDLGYEIVDTDRDLEVVCSLRTNMRLFLALACRDPLEAERAALALLACDVLGASLLQSSGNAPSDLRELGDLAPLMSEAGFSLADPAEVAS
jgi:hypothetical protein